MGFTRSVACGLAVASALVHGHPFEKRAGSVNVANSASSLTLLYQNNLNASDDVNHVSAILLDSMTQGAGQSACAALSESLLSAQTIKNYSSDFLKSLSYLQFSGRVAPQQAFFIQDGVLEVDENSELSFPAGTADYKTLPILCTQSNQASQPQNSTSTAANEIAVSAAGNTFLGYRNKKSFRFLGIPYADQPVRFTYSHLYSSSGQTINATAYGSQCVQSGGGSENCLFLNIQTPYVPKTGSTTNLRPVMFWIHGGGFTGGSGSDSLSDGGNLASREDLVVVTINYRLSTLGFLAIPGTNITGNFGIGDQITALEVELHPLCCCRCTDEL